MTTPQKIDEAIEDARGKMSDPMKLDRLWSDVDSAIIEMRKVRDAIAKANLYDEALDLNRVILKLRAAITATE